MRRHLSPLIPEGQSVVVTHRTYVCRTRERTPPRLKVSMPDAAQCTNDRTEEAAPKRLKVSQRSAPGRSQRNLEAHCSHSCCIAEDRSEPFADLSESCSIRRSVGASTFAASARKSRQFPESGHSLRNGGIRCRNDRSAGQNCPWVIAPKTTLRPTPVIRFPAFPYAG